MSGLDAILQAFIGATSGMFGNLAPYAQRLIFYLAVIDLALAAVLWALSEENALVGTISWMLRVGLFLWFVQGLEGLTRVISESFIQAGLAAGGGQITVEQFQSPDAIVTIGLSVAAPFLDFIQDHLGFPEAISNIGNILIMLLATFIIWASFLLIALLVMLTLIEWHLLSAAATLLIAFGVNRHTHFIAERVVGWLVGGGVRLFVTAMVASIAFPVVEAITPEPNPQLLTVFSVLGTSIVLATLSWLIPSIAAGVISGGGPSLSGGSVLLPTATMGIAGVASVRTLAYATRQTMRLARQARNRGEDGHDS